MLTRLQRHNNCSPLLAFTHWITVHPRIWIGRISNQSRISSIPINNYSGESSFPVSYRIGQYVNNLIGDGHDPILLGFIWQGAARQNTGGD